MCCGLAGKHDTVISYRDAILDLCNEAVDRFGLEGIYNVIEFNPYFVFSFPLSQRFPPIPPSSAESMTLCNALFLPTVDGGFSCRLKHGRFEVLDMNHVVSGMLYSLSQGGAFSEKLSPNTYQHLQLLTYFWYGEDRDIILTK